MVRLLRARFLKLNYRPILFKSSAIICNHVCLGRLPERLTLLSISSTCPKRPSHLWRMIVQIESWAVWWYTISLEMKSRHLMLQIDRRHFVPFLSSQNWSFLEIIHTSDPWETRSTWLAVVESASLESHIFSKRSECTASNVKAFWDFWSYSVRIIIIIIGFSLPVLVSCWVS